MVKQKTGQKEVEISWGRRGSRGAGCVSPEQPRCPPLCLHQETEPETRGHGGSLQEEPRTGEATAGGQGVGVSRSHGCRLEAVLTLRCLWAPRNRQGENCNSGQQQQSSSALVWCLGGAGPTGPEVRWPGKYPFGLKFLQVLIGSTEKKSVP